MKKKSVSQSAFFNFRVLILLALFTSSAALALFARSARGPGLNDQAESVSARLLVSKSNDTPVGGSWVITGSLNSARYAHTATLLSSGTVLVAGGEDDTGPLASAELYDAATGSWAFTGSLNTARQLHTATLLPN